MSLATRAVLGLAIGGGLLWLAVSHVDMEGASSALKEARVVPLVGSLILYWLAIGLRIVRWRKLLSGAASLQFRQVSKALIVGYAINNILPARLGELFRVDFLRRQYGVARSAGLGSIVVERLADALIAVGLLALGLGLSNLEAEHSALVEAAKAAAVGSGIGLAGLYVALRKRHWLPTRARWLVDRLEILHSAVVGIGWRQLALVAILSTLIWCLEALAIWLVAYCFGVVLPFGALCLVIGSAALSTLIPTAPGYFGSLQAAFVLSFSALGISGLLGLLSATMTQLLLFGSITLAGLGLLLASHMHGVLASLARSGGPSR